MLNGDGRNVVAFVSFFAAFFVENVGKDNNNKVKTMLYSELTNVAAN